MKENMAIWNKVAQPPKEALKKITGGRMSGKTNIDPQWRYQALTELFGPCGVGWKYEIVELWREEGSENQVFAFAKINLYIKQDDEWSEPIPGVGGSMLVANEHSGLYSSDEAYKMAVTDAVSVTLKVLGFGAAIYLGQWDGSKYTAINSVDAERMAEKIADWLSACENAAEGTIEDYRQWWTTNKEAITKDCGEAGAARIYAKFKALGKEKASKEEKE